MSDTTNHALVPILQNSLYVGSRAESIMMVIDYCRAAGLDVMQKPVHIVPINAKNPVSGQYEWRDVVMPGIGLYRIQADRSGTMAGITEPEFGPDVTSDFTSKDGKTVSFTHPEWCRVTVKKMVQGRIVDFTAREYWLENYATDSGKSTAPNAMWRKRPRGQIAKCTEAQALRKACPEIGAQPTAEEMEGKTIDMGEAERVIGPKPAQVVPARMPDLPPYPAENMAKNATIWRNALAAGKTTPDKIATLIRGKWTLSAEQEETIRAMAINAQAAPPLITYNMLAVRLTAATTTDELDEAASLIGGVENEKERSALLEIYENTLEKLNRER